LSAATPSNASETSQPGSGASPLPTLIPQPSPSSTRIWWFAFGYFACYVPYSALTKALSKGYIGDPVGGPQIVPISVAASMLAMFTVLSLLRWWKYARHVELGGRRFPVPTRWTALSGLATAAIVITTTLAYTFEGVSILFAMLLMRGGVLLLAPLIDTLSRRKVRWNAWVGGGLALSALFVAFAERGGYDISTAAAIDIGIYLAGYFVRLRLMSRLAKTGRREDDVRYFVEEQMVATPVLFLAIVALAVFGGGDAFTAELAAGFTSLWSVPTALIAVIVIGVLSQGTGLFGGLILLEPAENSYCVPINRSSSILAGVIASVTLWLAFGTAPPSTYQLAGAGLVVLAIVALSLPSILSSLRAKEAS